MKHLQESCQPIPTLELPIACLYGKEGERVGKALCITAQIPFTISLGSHLESASVFEQPDSDQACLLGMNVIPLLGIKVRHNNGTFLLVIEHQGDRTAEPTVLTVSLLTSVVVPSHKHCVLVAQSSQSDQKLTDRDFLFEQSQKVEANPHPYVG